MTAIKFVLVFFLGTNFVLRSLAAGGCYDGGDDSTDNFKRSGCGSQVTSEKAFEDLEEISEQPRGGKRDEVYQGYRPRAGREQEHFEVYRPRAGREGIDRPRAGREYLSRPRAGREYTIKILQSEVQGFGRPRAGRESFGRPRAGRESEERPRAGREDKGRPRAGRESGNRPRAGREYLGRPRAGREYGERPRAGREYLGRPRAGRESEWRPRAGRDIVLVLDDKEDAKHKRGFYLRRHEDGEERQMNSLSGGNVDTGLLDEREMNEKRTTEKDSNFDIENIKSGFKSNQPRSGKRSFSADKTLLSLLSAEKRDSHLSSASTEKRYTTNLISNDRGSNDGMKNQPRSGKRSILTANINGDRPRAGREDTSSLKETSMKRGFDFPIDEDGQKLVFLMANKRENKAHDITTELEKLAGSLRHKRGTK